MYREWYGPQCTVYPYYHVLERAVAVIVAREVAVAVIAERKVGQRCSQEDGGRLI